MIGLSMLSVNADSAMRVAHRFQFVFSALPRTRIVQTGVLVVLVSVVFSQTTLSTPTIRRSQTQDLDKGSRLFQEGQRLRELGTRAARIEAIDKYKAAYEFFRKENLRMEMAQTLFAAGRVYYSLGQRRRALEAFLEAARYIKETKDPALQAIIVPVIGLVYARLNEWKRAIEYIEPSLALLEAAKNPEFLAGALAGLGGAYIRLGQKQKQKGIEYLERSLSLVQETKDRNLETQLLCTIGLAFSSSLGQRKRGLELVQQALQLARIDKNRANEARVFSALGEIHNSIGDRQEALRDFNDALRVGQEAEDRSWKPTVLGHIAAIYLDFGDIDRSMALCEAGIKASETEGEPEDAAVGLNGLAMIASLRAEPVKALSYFQQALALARAIKDRSREAGALNNIASVYAEFNHYDLALRAIHEAVAIYSDDEDPDNESRALANMGSIYERMGQHG